MEIDIAMINRLNNIPWFRACGKNITISNVIKSENITSAKKTIQSIRWENMILEYNGDFTSQLSISFKKEYSEWNNLVKEFKYRHMPLLRKIWKSNLNEAGLNEKYVIADVAFNISAIVVIDAYKDLIPMPDFFNALLNIYESGYLPCGWNGKKDSGNFIVY